MASSIIEAQATHLLLALGCAFRVQGLLLQLLEDVGLAQCLELRLRQPTFA
jgi:hypothetical protein